MIKRGYFLLILLIVVFVIITSIIILTLFKINYFSEFQIKRQGYYVGNLHTHTFSSDGQMTYHEVIETARTLGFDFIAITDHDTISFATRFLCPIEKRILCIIGEEVSSKDGHILAIGITDTVPSGLSAEETIKRIHEQGGLVIPAHPAVANGLSIERIKGLSIDAIECNPHSKIENYGYSCQLLPNFPYVYNSDAHRREELGRIANRCWLANLSIEALKEAVKAGNCSEFKPGGIK
jgi:PHP family Zn ribbon phosphoesterase